MTDNEETTFLSDATLKTERKEWLQPFIDVLAFQVALEEQKLPTPANDNNKPTDQPPPKSAACDHVPQLATARDNTEQG